MLYDVSGLNLRFSMDLDIIASAGLFFLVAALYSSVGHAGASGYLLKKTPPARLLESLRETVEGGSPMSPEIARRVIRTASCRFL